MIVFPSLGHETNAELLEQLRLELEWHLYKQWPPEPADDEAGG